MNDAERLLKLTKQNIGYMHPSISRMIAAAPEGGIVLDYSIFSVGFTVLALLLIVEIARHKIDVYALHRPLLKTIVIAVYSELSTLGVVELFIFLLHKYSTINLEMEYVFAQFHFMLFFVAILNAFLTLLTASITFKISNNMWVQAEEIDLEYYVGLRAEYGKVVEKLEDRGIQHLANELFPTEYNIKRYFQMLRLRLTNSKLISHYQELLGPIRYHEMRVHFLLANDLPKTFKLSKYLKRCELHAMQSFAHIGTFSWLGLMAGFNLLYYFLGIVEYNVKHGAVMEALNGTLIAGCILSILISFLILLKMNSVYTTIMTAKFIDRSPGKIDESKLSLSIMLDGDKNQLELFWNSNPFLIIKLLQGLQFYFCIVVSFLIMFWGTFVFIPVPGYEFHPRILPIICVICYGAFLYIIARVIPIYTLCTSLGQLVRTTHLSEAKAMWRLDMKKKKKAYHQEEKQQEAKYKLKVDKHRSNTKTNCEENSNIEKECTKSKGLNIIHQDLNRDNRTNDAKSSREKMSRTPSNGFRQDSTSDSESSEKSEESDRLEKLSSLVFMSSKQLELKYNDSFSSRNSASRRRYNRRTRSEGVRDMFMMGNDDLKHMIPSSFSTLSDSSTNTQEKTTSPLSAGNVISQPQRRERKWRKKAISSGVEFMSGLNDNDKVIEKNNKMHNKVLTKDKGHEAKISKKSSVPRSTSCGSLTNLTTLLEDIPSRNVAAEELNIQVGRNQCKDYNVSSSTVSKNTKTSQIVSESKTAKASVLPIENRNDDRDVDLPAVMNKIDSTKISPSSLLFKISSFLSKSHYRIFSFAFGSMPCFFLVAMRLELLLVSDYTIAESNNTWHLNLSGAFSLEFIFLCWFMIISTFTITVFTYGPGYSYPSRISIIIAAVVDVMLSLSCLTLLLTAEMQRCKYQDICLPFGKNIGVGKIEPITAIVFLRVFRFYFSEKIYNIWLGKCRGVTPSPSALTLNSSIRFVKRESTSEYSDQESLISSENKQKDMVNILEKSGTILELWNTACGIRPDVIATYGEFSSEMLQVMLGLHVDIVPRSLDRNRSNTIAAAVTNVGQKKNSTSNSFIKLEKLYATLSYEVQAVIYAGKIGRPIKILPGRSPSLLDENIEYQIDEKEMEKELKDDDEVDIDSSFTAPNAILIRNLRRCEFRLLPVLTEWEIVDVAITKYEIVLFQAKKKEEEEHIGNNVHSYDIQELCNESPPSHERGHLIKKAIVATKGGKGLRLRDIAIDRKVTGHLNIKDITSSTIERFLPRSSSFLSKQRSSEIESQDHFDETVTHTAISNALFARQDKMVSSPSSPALTTTMFHDHSKRISKFERRSSTVSSHSAEIQVEYWDESMIDSSIALHTVNWKEIKEDQLCLKSCNGTTLFIRFFCDLKAGNEINNNIKGIEDEFNKSSPTKEKSNALIWCQTIVRICDLDVLTQHVPHLGEDDLEEMDLVHNHYKASNHNVDEVSENISRKSILKRVKSFHQLK